jgi:hypothetical protein
MDKFIGATLPYGNWKDLDWDKPASVGGLFHIQGVKLAMSPIGTFETCRLHRAMSVVGANPEDICSD